ncbi:S9 family peptidase [Alphaproteobacteria bacterium]|nr:S9 family peptidase [Alphaproteobacteria bacterium]
MINLTDLTPPSAKKIPVTVELHGRTRVDNYAWLKDENWQQVMQEPSLLQADIRSYLEAENAFTKSVMTGEEGLQEKLFAEIRGRIKEDESSVPSKDGPFEYYARYEEGGQHPIYCRKPVGGDKEEIIYHAAKEAEPYDFFNLGDCSHSPDHKLLAYSLDVKGSEYFTVTIRNLETSEEFTDQVTNCSGGIVWTNDSASFFYSLLDDNHRPYQVYRHDLGSKQSDDKLIYEEKDPGFFAGVSKTESDRFILVGAGDHQTSEVYFLANKDAEPRLIAERQIGIEYSVTDCGDEWLILTNSGDAEDFKIVKAPLDKPGSENWQDFVPHKQGHLVSALQVFKDFFVRLERVKGLPRIVVHELANGEEHEIAFDEQCYGLGMGGGYEFDTTQIRFSYSSPTTPSQVFDYDMLDRSRVLRKEQEIPSGHKAEDYVTKRIFAEASDGRKVPITLLYKAGIELDGSAPLVLYGYGSYGMSMPASFSTTRLSLVDRGVVYAVAHIRGGMEMGYHWYREGKTVNKLNTFTDFITCAEHLVTEGYSHKGGIAAFGGSAGGMLVGAVANMRPGLFKAIVAQVPFVDVLTTMCDDSLPLTPMEWPEWGNPLADAETYDRIASYSPVDNVEAKDYPHILVTAGLTDPRVTYWEPAKWVAKLRELKTDDKLLLLKTNMDAGHAGASGRFDSLKEAALIYAFLLKVFSD